MQAAREEATAQPPPRRQLRNLLGLAISAAALAAVVVWARGQERPEFPTAGADWLALAAAVGVYAVATLVRGRRWHAILRHAEIRHRASDATALVAVGYMGNTVLPARGGELLRIVLMGQRSDAKKREVLGSIVGERLLDAVALLGLFALLTLAGAAPRGLGSGLAVASVAAAVLLAAAAFAVFRIRRRGRLDRLAGVLRPFLRASRPLVSTTGLVLLAVTAAIWALEATIFWLVAQAVDIDVSFVEGTFLVVLTSFVMSIPAAPGYVGTFDAALLFGLSGYGVDGGPALTFALLWRFVLFVPITLAGLVLLFSRYGGFSVRRLRDAAPAPAPVPQPPAAGRRR